MLAAWPILGLLLRNRGPRGRGCARPWGACSLARLREARAGRRRCCGSPKDAEAEQDGKEIDEMDTEALIRMALANHRLMMNA